MKIPPKQYFWLLLVLTGLGLLAFVILGGREFVRNVYKSGLVQARTLQAWAGSFGIGVQVVLPIETRISDVDGMVQVFVPAGEFLMGEDDRDTIVSYPRHPVYLDAFWIDQTEVSNAMYALCVQDGVCRQPAYPEEYAYYGGPDYADYPAVYITWDEAQAYCHWAGRRLPTEAEWEKAARGVDGRTYPWGNEPPDFSRLNYDNLLGGPLPVNRYLAGASPYGALNMAGNVREWVADWYNQVYYADRIYDNPPGPEEPAGDSKKALRGGAFMDDAHKIRIFTRMAHVPWSAGFTRGFRCASGD